MLITVDAWGMQGKARRLSDTPGCELRVHIREERSGLDAAVAQIERKTRQHVCMVSPQGTSLVKGRPSSNHYQLTLGASCDGGYNVTGLLWIAVPVGTGVGETGYRG